MAYQPKSYKKFVATAATATLVASAVAPSALADEVSTAAFTDVASQYETAVEYVVSNNIAKGFSDTQFGVNAQIKRGDAAVMIAQAAGLMNEDAPVSGFSDVPERGQLAVNSLKAAGVVNGKSATEFDFHSPITRGEAALMLSRAYELTAETADIPFTDVIGTRYDDAVAALVENEVTDGISATQFGTYQNIKRGDFARFLYRLAEEDTEAPKLSYDGDKTIEVAFGSDFVFPVIVAEDNVDENLTVDSVIENGAGEEVDEIDTEVPGTYTITFSATDAAGNVSEDLVFTVVVNEEDVFGIQSVEYADADTVVVTFTNGETFTIELDEDLVDGENEVTFEFDGNEYTVTVDFDEVAYAEEVAENFIAELPALEDLTLEDAEAIANVRELVDIALDLNEEAEIEGLDAFVELEEALAALQYETNFEAALEAALAAIADLPEDITLESIDALDAAREAADAVYALDADAEIGTITVLDDAEDEYADLVVAVANVTDVSTSSFQITLNTAIKGLVADDFDVTLVTGSGDDEESEALDFEVSSNAAGTVYTFSHADLAGEQGTINVDFWETDLGEFPINYTATALQAAITAINTGTVTLDELQAPVLNLQNVNPEFVSFYQTEIGESFTNTVELIQAAIDRANVEEVENALEALNDADVSEDETALTAAEFLAALTDNRIAFGLDADEVISGNANAYLAAYLELVEEDEDFEFTSAQEVAEFVLAVNADALEGLVTDVNAATGQDDLLDAFEAINIENVIEGTVGGVEFPFEYFLAIQSANPSTIAEVQEVVEAVNLEEVTAAVAETVAVPTVENLGDARAIIAALLEVGVEAEVVSGFTEELDALEELVAVNTAVQADEFAGLQTALTNTDLGLEGVITTSDALTAYQTALENILESDEDFVFSSVTEIQELINEVNLTFIEAVNTAVADADEGEEASDFFTALAAEALNLTGENSENTGAYYAQYELLLEADEDFEFATVQEIQSFVTEVNQLVAVNAEDSSVLLQVAIDNDVTTYQNLTGDQRTEVAELVIDATPEGGFSTLAEVIEAIEEQTSSYVTLLANVNNADEIVEVDAALEALEIPEYDALPAGEQLDVAEAILAIEGDFATIDAVETAVLTETVEAIATLIAELPEAGTVTLADAAEIEAARDAYDALTDAQQELVDDTVLVTLEMELADLQALEAALAAILAGEAE
ncbi:S-layer homology domain-containing protein, partial [Planococcus salinus]